MKRFDDDDIAQDGEILRTSIFMMDRALHPADWALADALARLESAYDQRDHDLQNAWRR